MADYPFRSVLGILLCAALTFSFSRPNVSWWPIIAAIALVTLAYCIFRNRAALAQIYKEQKFDYSLTSTLDGPVWRNKPRIELKAIGIIFLGLSFILGAYVQATHPHFPSKSILRMIYNDLGNEGVVGFFCLPGVLLALIGVEAIVGRRVSQRPPNPAVHRTQRDKAAQRR
jgi:hypothetical protein